MCDTSMTTQSQQQMDQEVYDASHDSNRNIQENSVVSPKNGINDV